ncbi:RluA family pseudouridine synthase [Alkalicella caledoniensis]|uniref:Pseudouridine synthase n=1 Tax=Alkalicella caledoniensis TaxID=2731377 RepID=A0A7G9WCC0_ALKCA|nr:RluA family pseudouridine synthase [Alkalicella caledoniensis]QNO16332.1 RluA family pseudouridine synthase [Alkalicella caledoniensis]
MYDEMEIIATENKRIDGYLADELQGISRSQIQKLIINGNVKVNGVIIYKVNHKLKPEDTVIVTIPDPEDSNVNPENIPLEIVYQDKDLAVINKPRGMVVHPAPGHSHGTMVNALLYHIKDLSTIGGVIRPGIVHRLDKDTSGLLVIAKNDAAHQDLSNQMKDRTTKKIYWAIAEGIIKEEKGVIHAPIARHPVDRQKMAVVTKGRTREAITHFNVLERFKNHTLVELKLETGRTHQIRVHLSYIGHPLLGDPTYGFKKQKFKSEGQILHAKTLGLTHPKTGQWMEWDSEIPLYFNNMIKKVSL